jgi:hypothetical protein
MYYKVRIEWDGGVSLALNVQASSVENAEKSAIIGLESLGLVAPQPKTVKAVALAPAHWPSGNYVDALHVARRILMDHYSVYIHIVSKDNTEYALNRERPYEPQEWVQARFELEDDSIGLNESEWLEAVFNQHCTECGAQVAYTIATTLAQRPVKLCTQCYSTFFDHDGRRRTED